MKVRRLVILVVIISVVFFALVIWLRKKSTETASSSIAGSNAEPSFSTERATTELRPREPASGDQTNARLASPQMETKGEQMRQGLAELNNEDVLFYGRVIDQFGLPVPNARVIGNIQVNDGTRVGTDIVSRTTDADGFFTINGYKGKALGINVTKGGYVLATTNTRFVYSLLWPEAERYVPDPNNPAVIKMWKLQGAQPLIIIDKSYKLPFTDASITFDLIAGNVVPSGGDLEVIVTRASGPISQRDHGDWSIELKAVNGGIMESDFQVSRLTFEAPATGYQDSYLVRMNRDDPKWSDNVQKVFFLKSRGAKFIASFHSILGSTATQMARCGSSSEVWRTQTALEIGKSRRRNKRISRR